MATYDMQITTSDERLYQYALALFRSNKDLEFLDRSWRVNNVTANHGEKSYGIYLAGSDKSLRQFTERYLSTKTVTDEPM